MSTEPGHSRLSPSAANRWVPCPGSVVLCESFQIDRTHSNNDAAEEGTAAHEFAALWVRSGVRPEIGATSSNGWVFTHEMCEAVGMYVDIVRDHNVGVVRIEEPIRCSSIHPDCFGTPDYWSYDPVKKHLWLPDYKHGFAAVEVFENYQPIIYADGVLDYLGCLGHDPDEITVEVVIIQPRAYHRHGPIRSWKPSQGELSRMATEARTSAAAALSGTPCCIPGPHCGSCRGRAHCEANNKVAANVMDFVSSAIPTNMTPQEQGVEYVFLKRALSLLQKRLDAVEAEVKHHASNGTRIPAVSTTHGKGRLVWSRPVGEVLALGTIYDVDLKQPDKPITPKQAIALGLPESLVNSSEFSERTATGIKITEASSSDAALIFGGNTP